jgi:hypothetical protein
MRLLGNLRSRCMSSSISSREASAMSGSNILLGVVLPGDAPDVLLRGRRRKVQIRRAPLLLSTAIGQRDSGIVGKVLGGNMQVWQRTSPPFSVFLTLSGQVDPVFALVLGDNGWKSRDQLGRASDKPRGVSRNEAIRGGPRSHRKTDRLDAFPCSKILQFGQKGDCSLIFLPAHRRSELPYE